MYYMHKDIFSLRQTMVRPDFECYHYFDIIPPVVDFHEHEFYEVFFFYSDIDLILPKRLIKYKPHKPTSV